MARLPHSVELLQRKRKSTVYRLGSANPGGGDVIAKRAPEGVVRHERLVYEEILPHLPVPAPLCLGAVEEKEHSWIFLEDVGGEAYLAEDESHRVLAGRWIGELHAAAPELAGARQLPQRGPNYYREHLETARNNILCNLDNAAATADDRIVLGRIVANCEACASAWPEVEEVCGRMPETLVHNDFRERNVRIRGSGDSAALLCFDWELSGWGVLGADLAQFTGGAVSPDLRAYWTAVRQAWPRLRFADVEEFSRVGSMFRLLASVRWASENLTHQWIERAMTHMRIYQGKLGLLTRLRE